MHTIPTESFVMGRAIGIFIVICGLTALIKRKDWMVDMKTTIIYTSPHCPWCKKAKEYLDSHAIPYQEVDVSDEEARQEAIEKAGRYAVPVIDLDGKIQVGYEKEEFDEFFESFLHGR